MNSAQQGLDILHICYTSDNFVGYQVYHWGSVLRIDKHFVFVFVWIVISIPCVEKGNFEISLLNVK